MIAEKLLGHLNKCIQLYDEKCGRDYVIVFGKGKKSAVNYCRITFNEYNFWHLLGCKLNEKIIGKYIASAKMVRTYQKNFH